MLLPLVLGGPELLLAGAARSALGWLGPLYWPIVVIGLPSRRLTTLFWIALPVPNSWWRGMPGRRAGAGRCVAGQLRRAADHPLVGRRHVDLRSAGRSDRGADLAVLPSRS